MYIFRFPAVGFALLLLAAPGRATDYTWTNNAGGTYSTASNWSPAVVPGVNDRALFTSSNVYTVNFTASATNLGMQVGNASTVTLNIGSGHTYTLTSGANVALGYQANLVTVTTVSSGSLVVGSGGMAIGTVANSTGTLNVQGSTAVFNDLGYVDVGQFGTGTLDVSGGAAGVVGADGVGYESVWPGFSSARRAAARFRSSS